MTVSKNTYSSKHKTFTYYDSKQIVDNLISEEAELVKRLSHIESLLKKLLELRQEEGDV